VTFSFLAIFSLYSKYKNKLPLEMQGDAHASRLVTNNQCFLPPEQNYEPGCESHQIWWEDIGWWRMRPEKMKLKHLQNFIFFLKVILHLNHFGGPF